MYVASQNQLLKTENAENDCPPVCAAVICEGEKTKSPSQFSNSPSPFRCIEKVRLYPQKTPLHT